MKPPALGAACCSSNLCSSVVSKDFAQCGNQPVILFRRTNAQPHVISEHRILAHIPHQNIMRVQRLKQLLRRYRGAYEHKVGRRWHWCQTLDLLQGSKEPRTFAHDRLNQWAQEVEALNRYFSRHHRKEVK